MSCAITDINPASFHDPSGFIFTYENEIYRAIAPSYFENFSLLTKSELYKTLISKKLIVEHSEREFFLPGEYSTYKIIKPEKIPFISYPYEWCFSQLKDAALLTLIIQKEALKYGMLLKDASAYNIQFIGAKPIFIDTLSFEKYEEGKPWIAYRQFCQHFLSPLALMHYKSTELSKLSINFIDGIPLELASSLLPKRSYLNSGIASHVHIHAKIQEKITKQKKSERKIALSKKQLLNIVEHLIDTISSLKLKTNKSHWNKYASENTYSVKAKEAKSKIIFDWLLSVKPKTIFDVGCNTGDYTLQASKLCDYIVAIDSDHQCIESFYNSLSGANTKNILPLIVDLANPTPAIGWANEERKTISQRGKADVLLALAFIHHLRIRNNIPFHLIANYFSEITHHLIIEYIPKDDRMVKEMIAGREDIFADYTQGNFTSAFEKYFLIKKNHSLPDSGRMLFLMTKKIL
ncbi:MAG: SAM-dependent methyltransferase [Bacteroidota bacterium]